MRCARLYLMDTLSPSLKARALALAMQAHQGQYRRDGKTPYLMHVLAVAMRAPQDEVSQAVALLHDSFEADAAHILKDDDLRAAGMSEDVIEGRDTLTKAAGETYAAYILRIKRYKGGKWAPHKRADLLANLSDSPSDGQVVRYAKALLVLAEDAP